MGSLTEQATPQLAAYSTSRATGRTPNGEHNFYFELGLCRKAFSFEAGHHAGII